jgi:prepilin-type N-terminal cleavage/methylation domain-containing protein
MNENEFRGFTLIELLVVISIISLLSSIVLASLNSARDKGRIGAAQIFEAGIKHSNTELVGEWTFNDDTLKDTSGNNNNGVINVNNPTLIDGVVGRAVSFNGTNQYVQITDSTSLDIIKTLTISVWFKSNGSQVNWPRLISKGLAANWPAIPYEIVLMPDASGGVVQFHTTNNLQYCDGSKKVSDDKWHHLVVVYDGNLTGVNVNLYVDGNKETTSGCQFSATLIVDNNPLWIGSAGGAVYMKGSVDDVRIYSKTLTVFEIQKQYTEGLLSHQDLALR